MIIKVLMPNNTTYEKTNITVSGEAQAFEDMGKELSERQLHVRQEALSILMKNFGGSGPSASIYNCAHEWCEKQYTTSGLVKYYDKYYNKSHDNT